MRSNAKNATVGCFKMHHLIRHAVNVHVGTVTRLRAQLGAMQSLQVPTFLKANKKNVKQDTNVKEEQKLVKNVHQDGMHLMLAPLHVLLAHLVLLLLILLLKTAVIVMSVSTQMK